MTLTVYRVTIEDADAYLCSDREWRRLQRSPDAPATKRIAQLMPGAEEETYELRPYTFGEQTKAQFHAHELLEGERVFSALLYQQHLLGQILGKSPEDIADMHPGLAQILAQEVETLTHPLGDGAKKPTSTVFLATKQPPYARLVETILKAPG